MKNMTMHRELTHKEIKLINELLDGQLPAEKAKQAFLQIKQDAALRDAYEKLRWTKSLLRQAPRRKVPHHFTLTRQMAQEATGFYRLRRQTFSIAGAMASFLFVILLAVQMVPLAMGTMIPVAMKSEDIASMEEAPMMMEALPEEESFEMQAEEESMAKEMPEEQTEMESAPLEESEIVDESPSAEVAAEPEEEFDDAAQPEATMSPENATGGGLEDGEEVGTLDEAGTAQDEVAEERIIEDTPSDVEMEIAAIEDEGELDSDTSVTEEARPDDQVSEDWIFLTTVLSGLLAFVFIFISIRDKNRGTINN